MLADEGGKAVQPHVDPDFVGVDLDALDEQFGDPLLFGRGQASPEAVKVLDPPARLLESERGDGPVLHQLLDAGQHLGRLEQLPEMATTSVSSSAAGTLPTLHAA